MSRTSAVATGTAGMAMAIHTTFLSRAVGSNTAGEAMVIPLLWSTPLFRLQIMHCGSKS